MSEQTGVVRTLSLVVALGLTLVCWSAAQAADAPAPLVMYTKGNAPPTPKVENLPLKESVSQDGVTWTFDKPARVGQFITGGWYVVDKVTVVKIDPAPLYGAEVKDATKEELAKPGQANLIRNGSLLNIPLDSGLTGFDSRCGNFTAKQHSALPITMNPGDALISTISEVKPHSISGGSSGVKSASVLTCLKAPVPADAWRPSYGDRQQTIYLARNLRRELLPNLPHPKAAVPELARMAKTYAAPWLEVSGFGRDGTSYQKEYGRMACQVSSEATLSLMLDYKPEEKEPLLVNYVQYAIDIYGLLKNGFRGWPAWGGWGSGRKWPIVFAGLMLGDQDLANVSKTLPKALLGEDMHVMYDKCWTGAGVVYAGHTGTEGGKNEFAFGPYEHLQPSRWMIGSIGQAYRCDMTSSTWIGQALAIHLLNAEAAWSHDDWLDYCDRWMDEPNPGFETNTKQGELFPRSWVWVKEMWDQYRNHLPPLPVGQRQPHPTAGWKIAPPKDSASVAVEIGKNREFRVKGQPFFPLMMFAETPARIGLAKSLGLNTIAEGNFMTQGMSTFVNNAAFMDELAKNGLYGVFGADMRVAGHPNLLGWIQVDEPDKILGLIPIEMQRVLPCYEIFLMHDYREQKVTPPQILVSSAYEWMKKTAPSRPVFLTLGAPFIKGEGLLDPALKENADPDYLKSVEALRQKSYPEYLKSCDVAGCAVYPITYGHTGGKIEGVARGVTALRELAGGKPVFAWIEVRPQDDRAKDAVATRRARVAMAVEAALPKDAPDDKAARDARTRKAKDAIKEVGSGKAAKETHGMPTPEQVRAEAWMAVISGATAIGYRGFEGFDDVKLDPAMAAELQRLNVQIARLAPALLAAPAKAEITLGSNAAGHARATNLDGDTYVFAQNMAAAKGQATIKLAGVMAGAEVEVVDENRTVTAGDGRFADEFGPFQEHVYRIAK